MIKAIAITNNICFVKKLVNEIYTKELDISLVEISQNKSEALDILKNLEPDIIFLDKAISKLFDKSFLSKYINIIVLLTYTSSNCLIAPKHLQEINEIINSSDIAKSKSRIIHELEYIGYNLKHKGTNYLIDTILEMFIHRDNMDDNLQGHIYPLLADKYHKTPFNIKSSIHKATDRMYSECDVQKLINYFHFSYDTKPTIKQVVFAVYNKI